MSVAAGVCAAYSLRHGGVPVDVPPAPEGFLARLETRLAAAIDRRRPVGQGKPGLTRRRQIKTPERLVAETDQGLFCGERGSSRRQQGDSDGQQFDSIHVFTLFLLQVWRDFVTPLLQRAIHSENLALSFGPQ
jgi:hypothetical protein